MVSNGGRRETARVLTLAALPPEDSHTHGDVPADFPRDARGRPQTPHVGAIQETVGSSGIQVPESDDGAVAFSPATGARGHQRTSTQWMMIIMCDVTIKEFLTYDAD
jgi:hypothetical protein